MATVVTRDGFARAQRRAHRIGGLRPQRLFQEPERDSALLHVLPRCAPGDPRERTGCWPAPETTENINKSKVGNLGLSDAEEDAIVSFMQTLSDGFGATP
jgi:hypothetical protein